MFRALVFYPLMALLAVGVVLVSFGPGLIQPEERSVSGAIKENVLTLSGADLSYPRGGQNLVFYVARDERWSPSGLRVAVRPGAGDVQPSERGVQILLAPETGEWLGAGPFRVEVNTTPLPLTAAGQMALGISRGGRTEWSAQPIAPIRGSLVYRFPRGAAARVESFALRPITTDNDGNRGVEVRSIRVTRLGGA